MTWRSAAILVATVALTACIEGPFEPPFGEAPPLEAVEFQLLGSGKVLFQRYGRDGGTGSGVYLIDAGAGASRVVLDSVRGSVRGPALSPDGERVAWGRWTDLTYAYDVYVTDLSGGAPRRISSFPSNTEGPPAWAPDGSAIVFFNSGVLFSSTPWGTLRRDLDTDALTALRTFTLGAGGEVHCPALTLPEDAVSVSGAGGLAYACGAELVVATGPDVPLTSRYVTGSADARIFGTAWSPDDGRVAFMQVDYGTEGTYPVVLTTSVRVLDLADGQVRTLAVLDGSGTTEWSTENHISVCWLPGGERLVFNAFAPGVTGSDPSLASLYVVGADGQGLARLTTAADVFDHSVSCSGGAY
jgi:Tol biopolymer transport system component